MIVRLAVRNALRGGVRLAIGTRSRDAPNVPPSPDWEGIAPLFVAFSGRFDFAMNASWPAQ